MRDGFPSVYTGATWQTDAPFRRTESTIDRAHEAGLLAVEIEAPVLYAFARERDHPVVCFAHVTNEMGDGEGNFEKGEVEASVAALDLIAATITGRETQTGE